MCKNILLHLTRKYVLLHLLCKYIFFLHHIWKYIVLHLIRNMFCWILSKSCVASYLEIYFVASYQKYLMLDLIWKYIVLHLIRNMFCWILSKKVLHLIWKDISLYPH